MLRWAIAFFVIAIICAILPGLAGLSGIAMQIGYILAVLFVILFIVSLVVGRGNTPAV